MQDDPRFLALYLVEWDDSRQPTSEWAWLNDVKPDIVKCRTIGFYIASCPESFTLAMSIGDVRAEKLQGNGIIHIPVRAITTMHILANPIKEPG